MSVENEQQKELRRQSGKQAQPESGQRRRREEQPGSGQRRRREAQPGSGQRRRREEQPESGQRRRREEQPGSGQRRRREEQPESGQRKRREEQPGSGQRRRREEQPGSGRHPQNGKQPESGTSRRKKKNTVGEVFSVAILLVAVCVFVFSAYQLAMMLLPYYFGGKDYDQIKDLVITTDKNNPDKFEVDFDTLLEQNPDTVAWLRFEEPEIISYPVVKSKDNEEYLTKTFSANDNKLGAIFVDMRCTSSFSDRNTLIYGHNLKVGGEMFSQLNEYADEAFCKAHPYFYIYTPNGEELVYKIFSAGVVKDTAENYNLTYASDEEFLEYLELCRETSNYQVDVELNAQSRIVSLSTCTNVNDDERFLLQGVLIEGR